MGDTGSLFLGGAVCGLAIMLKQPITLLIVDLCMLWKRCPVIMQVTSYKLTGKRIFKMSPIHHHFEMCGWSEVTIVCVFSAVTVLPLRADVLFWLILFMCRWEEYRLVR